MTVKDLRKHTNEVPFEQFIISLASGEVVAVKYPENISFSENSTTATIYDDDDWHKISLSMITMIEPISWLKRTR